MRHILLISIFIGLSAAGYFAETCTYVNSEGEYIEFSQLGGWLNFTDGDSTWFVNACPQNDDSDASDNACADISGATLCKVSKDGKVSVRGQINETLWSDYDNGVEVMYSSEEACYIDPLNAATSNYKTVIDYVCNPDVDMDASVSIDNKADQCSLVTINIQTYSACAISPNVIGEEPIEPVETVEVSFGFFVPIIAFIIAFFVCCCCCCARRRRCRQQRICQQQFSNLAFQPVPSSTQATRPAVNGASFNPYVPQPQYYYYYPTQQTVQQVPLENMAVSGSDEMMARELQAQYDREAAQL